MICLPLEPRLFTPCHLRSLLRKRFTRTLHQIHFLRTLLRTLCLEGALYSTFPPPKSQPIPRVAPRVAPRIGFSHKLGRLLPFREKSLREYPGIPRVAPRMAFSLRERFFKTGVVPRFLTVRRHVFFLLEVLPPVHEPVEHAEEQLLQPLEIDSFRTPLKLRKGRAIGMPG